MTFRPCAPTNLAENDIFDYKKVFFAWFWGIDVVATTTSKQQRQQSSHITTHCSKTGTSELLAVLEIAHDDEEIKAFCHRFCMMEARFALRAQLRSLQMAILWKCDDNKQICSHHQAFFLKLSHKSLVLHVQITADVMSLVRLLEPTVKKECSACSKVALLRGSPQKVLGRHFLQFSDEVFLRCSCELI